MNDSVEALVITMLTVGGELIAINAATTYSWLFVLAFAIVGTIGILNVLSRPPGEDKEDGE